MSEENTATETSAEQVAHTGTQEEPGTDSQPVPEHFRKELEEARREAARYRTERNELRADAESWRTQQEAEKTELQKATERLASQEDAFKALEAENTRLRLAARYGIAEENHDLLGSGSPEEIEDRAKRLAAMQKEQTRPPSNTPVEQLGAAVRSEPETPPNAFPAGWPV
ncbi:hypothetical protein I6H48_00680 [Corynebacterium amycolatum]|uniref:Scaffolding protein n=1 Tax=Corynebacterium amycolatum TaxID=43765 RepID=A0A7T4G5U3_CORAY|nr:hypothetical protein [Corynebacterium amycolatum]MCQ9128170.1 hypothetical protein [Corynebacterium amycolatum]MCQ9141709.1 hypothetical protein [Corynebacterium amycolatum]QQB82819.1 hypothetical protein I6H48_00680 [Corynebacterium amycolatum]